MTISQALRNTNLIFLIFIALGFLVPGFAGDLKILLIPALITMMSFSLMNLRLKDLKFDHLKSALLLAGINSIILSAIYIAIAYLFIDFALYRDAVIILGLMPPAVGVISLIFILDADMNVGFIALIISYILSLFIIPIFTHMFFGETATIMKLIRIIALVILAPFLISRFFIYINSKVHLIKEETTEIVVNLCYGLLFYISIGVNIDVFLGNISGIIPLILIFLFLRFGMAFIIYFITRKSNQPDLNKLLILFGSYKNFSAGMAITVLLFGIKATVPYAVFSIIASFYIVFTKWFLS